MSEGPPLRARLHRYKVDGSEFLVLTAMCEANSFGSTIWVSVERLAAYSKLSTRTVQRVLRRLQRRGILSELAPANSLHTPATYRINEGAFEDDPKVMQYIELDRQRSLPGIVRPPIPGEPIEAEIGVSNCHPVSDCHQGGDTVSPDSRIDSRFSPLPIVDSPVFVLEENARAREAQHLPKPTDEDFLARDLRKLADAENKLALRCQAAIGSGTRMTEEQFFEVACELAGIAVKRGLEVKAWGKKWPAQEGSA